MSLQHTLPRYTNFFFICMRQLIIEQSAVGFYVILMTVTVREDFPEMYLFIHYCLNFLSYPVDSTLFVPTPSVVNPDTHTSRFMCHQLLELCLLSRVTVIVHHTLRFLLQHFFLSQFSIKVRTVRATDESFLNHRGGKHFQHVADRV